MAALVAAKDLTYERHVALIGVSADRVRQTGWDLEAPPALLALMLPHLEPSDTATAGIHKQPD